MSIFKDAVLIRKRRRTILITIISVREYLLNQGTVFFAKSYQPLDRSKDGFLSFNTNTKLIIIPSTLNAKVSNTKIPKGFPNICDPMVKMQYSNTINDHLEGIAFMTELPEGSKRITNILRHKPPLTQNLPFIASQLLDHIKKYQSITITTGFPTFGTFETDGPVGAFLLGNFLSENEINVQITTEQSLLDVMKRLPWTDTPNSSLEFINIANLTDIGEILVSIERPGQNIQGIYHNMKGNAITSLIDDIETKIDENLPKYWLSIGDGGNELGLGALKSRIQAVIPYGRMCKCSCGQGIAVEKNASDYLLGITSNIATLILIFELAHQMGTTFDYSWKREVELLKILNQNKIIDGVTGESGTVDGIDPRLMQKILKSISHFFRTYS